MSSSDTLIAPADVLAHTRFFGDLDRPRLERVAALAQLQERPEGELVYRNGDRADCMYVLARGLVRMAVGYQGRNASAGDLLRRGDVFGWAALTPGSNVRIATVTCLAPCTLLALDGAALLLLMEQDHTLGYRITTQLTRLITTTLSAFAGG